MHTAIPTPTAGQQIEALQAELSRLRDEMAKQQRHAGLQLEVGRMTLWPVTAPRTGPANVASRKPNYAHGAYMCWLGTFLFLCLVCALATVHVLLGHPLSLSLSLTQSWHQLRVGQGRAREAWGDAWRVAGRMTEQ